MLQKIKSIRGKDILLFFKNIPIPFYLIGLLLWWFVSGGLENYHDWTTFKKIIVLLGFLSVVNLLVLLYTMHIKKMELFRVYLPMGFIFGLMMMLLIPMYCAPDEHYHYWKAYQISNEMMGIDSPDDGIKMRIGDFSMPVKTAYKGRDELEKYYAKLDDGIGDEAMLIETDNIAVNEFDYQYYLPAVGITIGRLLHMGAVPTALLGRLMNLILYTGLVALAIYAIPKGKMVLFMVAMLPMSLQQAASFSYDALINSTSIVVLAFTAKILMGEIGKMTKPFWAVYAISAMLLASTKHYCYILVALLPVVTLPFVWKEKEYRKKILAVLILVLTATVLLGVYKALVDIGEPIGTGILGGDDNCYTVGTILHDRRLIPELIFRTFNVVFTWHILSMLGEQLGWFNILLPGVFTYCWIVLLLCSGLRKNSEEHVFGENAKTFIERHRYFGMGLVAFLTVGFVYGGMLLVTPVTSTTIMGVQGRYFLPVLPIALLGLKKVRIRIDGDTHLSDQAMILWVFFLEMSLMFIAQYRL